MLEKLIMGIIAILKVLAGVFEGIFYILQKILGVLGGLIFGILVSYYLSVYFGILSGFAWFWIVPLCFLLGFIYSEFFAFYSLPFLVIMPEDDHHQAEDFKEFFLLILLFFGSLAYIIGLIFFVIGVFSSNGDGALNFSLLIVGIYSILVPFLTQLLAEDDQAEQEDVAQKSAKSIE